MRKLPQFTCIAPGCEKQAVRCTGFCNDHQYLYSGRLNPGFASKFDPAKDLEGVPSPLPTVEGEDGESVIQ